MSYAANFPDLYRRSADLVDKILRGTNPGDIPVEQPTKFDFVTNLTTAKALGLTIPESFLSRADEVSSEREDQTPRFHHAHRRRGGCVAARGARAAAEAGRRIPQWRVVEWIQFSG
jgi:putative ABC transport system substrate-binding protein